ncbi:hypothetical protein JXB12_12295 [candidate division KSB1 bacterium]|nr:hypothetical protein [candidate division KSB1 bacterium]
MKRNVYIAALITIVFLGSCGNDNGFTPPPKDAQILVEEGWEKFSYRGYQNALSKFEEAITKDDTYAEAYCGAGWAAARIPDLPLATDYFTQCIALDADYADAYAGLAFVYNASKLYQNSITSAQTVLTINDTWSFTHDITLDYKDICLILAENYFALGDLSSSLAQVKILNPAFNANISSFEGKQALADEIERLRAII